MLPRPSLPRRVGLKCRRAPRRRFQLDGPLPTVKAVKVEKVEASAINISKDAASEETPATSPTFNPSNSPSPQARPTLLPRAQRPRRRRRERTSVTFATIDQPRGLSIRYFLPLPLVVCLSLFVCRCLSIAVCLSLFVYRCLSIAVPYHPSK